MRLLSGLILGVLITVGAAYIHDASVAGAMSGPDGSGYRMVNWDVVGRSFHNLAAGVHDEFNRLTGHPPSEQTPDKT